MSIVNLPFNDLEEELGELQAKGLKRRVKTFVPKGPTKAVLDGKEVTLFASNDYLGLAWDARVIGAFQKAAGTHGVGSGASRLITGTSNLHTALEERVAKFKHAEAGIVFSSGYLANWGTITALVGKDDFLAIDKLNHASIIDAARASGAMVRIFPHKDYVRLEKLLHLGAGYKKRLIVTDSVFSMDGDTADLKELVRLKKLYGAWLMIDEAHGTGVFGKRGAGVAEEQGVEEEIDVRMGTFSKACGTMGGFVVGSVTLIEYLRNPARSFIYSTALPPAVMAATMESINIIENEPERRKKLWKNVRCLKGNSPIIPIIIGDEDRTMKISGALLEQGFYVPGIRPPSVPKGESRLRVTVSAAHTQDDLNALTEALKKTGGTHD